MRMKGFFLVIDALLALSLVLILSYAVVASVQDHDTGLLELRQLGRDYLDVQKRGLDPSAALAASGFKAGEPSPPFSVSASAVVYPECDYATTVSCFASSETSGLTAEDVTVAVKISP